jgi:hypothetical protein
MLLLFVINEPVVTGAQETVNNVASVTIRTGRRNVVDFAGVVAEEKADDFVFTMEDIKDADFRKRTFSSYVGPIHIFLKFCAEAVIAPYSNVLTEYGRENVNMLERKIGEKLVTYNARRIIILQTILRESSEWSLFDINILYGDDMMNYFLLQKGIPTGKMLSRAMFCSAINHLYRCRNRSGFPHIAADHLKTFFKGLHRSFAQRKNPVAIVEYGLTMTMVLMLEHVQ